MSTPRLRRGPSGDMDAIKALLGLPGKAVSAVLAPISPVAENRQGEFAMSMIVANTASVTGLTLCALGYLDPLLVLKSETAIFFVKWVAEVEYDDFKWDRDWDLWLHHLGFVAAVAVCGQVEPEHAPSCAYLILSFYSIHFPLLFRWIRRVCQKDMHDLPRVADACDTTYLALWPAVASLRSFQAARILSPAMCPPSLTWIRQYNSMYIGLMIPVLDYFWTPWGRYFPSMARGEKYNTSAENKDA
mmetsp:Transcript_801/g.2340  ORF Transcript_801/g.2340 Transcript_801/m.2340 type:complete len:245 (-) Transcript_801:1366-2100(-)